MTTEPSISEQASVATNVAAMKRGLRMSWFADKKDHLKVGLAFEDGPLKGNVEKCTLVLGQIIGVIFAVEERTFTGADGEVATQLVALGDFEAVKYETGESASMGTASLPRYYLEGIRAALSKDVVTAVNFAIEISLVPTGKQVPTAYEVKNLIPREADSPLNTLKRKLAAANRLRLSPPEDVPAIEQGADMIEGDYNEKENVPSETDQGVELTGNAPKKGAKSST